MGNAIRQQFDLKDGDLARRYADELRELPGTYEAIRAIGAPALREVVRIQAEFDRRDAYFVGSGGAVAMAQFAASVHARKSTHVSRAGTPLSLTVGRSLRVTNATVGLFSARARHPDVRLAARAVRAQPGNQVVLLTQLEASEVSPELAAVVDEIVVLPRTTSDGFLATNSILAMAAAWLMAAEYELPETLPMLNVDLTSWPEGVSRALVLYGPDQLPAALDLEARLSETGLLDVQLADLRNMAHGRHVGLLARAASTAVIALGDPSSQALVDKTINVLPTSIPIIDLSTTTEGPAGTLDTLVGCMRLVGEIGSRHGVDPGRPHVGVVGRKLYHLPWSRLAAAPDGLRAARAKALAAGMSDANEADLGDWSDAREAWDAEVAGRRIEAVVLDYDGTCVPTPRRTSPPPADVQAEIVRLLRLGVRVAVASGRGPSVIEELQRWVPREYWGTTLVGIYNGGVINPLGTTVARGSSPTSELRAAAELLVARLVGAGWSVSARQWQITVERRGSAVSHAAAAVSAVLASEFDSRLKVIESGHSVDIVPSGTTKRAVVHQLDAAKSEVLLIGDRGDVGGNDFELLSYSTLSLSVDQVSADPSRCWNLSEDGTSGPDLLVKYLQRARPRRGGRVIWEPPISRRGK